MKKYFYLVCLCLSVQLIQIYGQINQNKEKNIHQQIRFIRAFGDDDEKKAPIIVLENNKSSYNATFGSKSITIEFDISTEVPPSMFAKFIHCSADWQESENMYLNDFINLKTSNIEWQSAPAGQNYYSYRGRIKLPDTQVKFTYAGNWKAKLYDYSND